MFKITKTSPSHIRISLDLDTFNLKETFLGRHRVRATFYHVGAVVFLITTALTIFGIIGVTGSYIITATLFVVDYIAEMYDPHPENPGPWFERHFHRFLDDDTE